MAQNRAASSTPRTTDPTPWDNPLPLHLDDYLTVWNNRKDAQGWEIELCQFIAVELQRIVSQHLRDSPKSRLLFSTMPTEHWMIKGQFVFTKRNFAILHPPVAQECNDYVLRTLRSKCLGIQSEINLILPVILASQNEYDQAQAFFQAADYYFENVAEHCCEQEYWRAELRKRYPLIVYLRDREKVVDRLVTFEEWKLDPSKYNDRQTTMNEDAKFRRNASDIIKTMNSEALRRVRVFEQCHNRPFLVYGNRYMDYLEASVSEFALVKTNFNTLSRSSLVLLINIPETPVQIKVLIAEFGLE